jgi:hypothetical protein
VQADSETNLPASDFPLTHSVLSMTEANPGNSAECLSLRGSGVMARNTAIREGMMLQIRAEVFNAFNHAQFGNPNGPPDSIPRISAERCNMPETPQPGRRVSLPHGAVRRIGNDRTVIDDRHSRMRHIRLPRPRGHKPGPPSRPGIFCASISIENDHADV